MLFAMPRKPNIADDLLLNKVVLRPEREHARFPEMLGQPFESFLTPNPANGRTIGGWYFEPQAATGAALRPLALLNPSNRGTKADALDHAAALLDAGCRVLLYDYEGFGDSAGAADVRTLVTDAQAALAWAGDRTIWSDDEPLIVMGLSLGTLVATRLAVLYEHAVRALVLDGAIEPFLALRRSFGPLGAATAEVACSQIPAELDTSLQIQSVTCPVLFVHGENDTIGTLDEARHLISRTKHATLWALEDCDHLDIVCKHPDEYRRRLGRFLALPAVP